MEIIRSAVCILPLVDLQSVFYPRFAVCSLQSTIYSLHSAFYTDRVAESMRHVLKMLQFGNWNLTEKY